MKKKKCGECGKPLSSWTERHTYEHCQLYIALKSEADAVKYAKV